MKYVFFELILIILLTALMVLLMDLDNITIRAMKGDLSMKLSDKLYNILKYICQIALPAIGGLYFALAQIWSLPYAEQIVGSISAVTAFLGILLGISTYNYNKEE